MQCASGIFCTARAVASPSVSDAETQMLEESYTDADGVITVAYTAVDLPAPEDEGAGEDEL